MDTKYRTLTESEMRKVFMIEDRYNQVKTNIIDAICEYVKLVDNSSSKTKKFIKKQDDMHLEISYCDETIILDSSNLRKIDEEYYACIRTFKEVKEFGLVPTAPKYLQIGNCMYSDGQYVYDFVEGKMKFSGIAIITALNSFIFETLLHIFD